MNWDKQDGYHNRPQYLGFDEKKHPGWEATYTDILRQLFINWHPGLLGHEVIGPRPRPRS